MGMSVDSDDGELPPVSAAGNLNASGSFGNHAGGGMLSTETVLATAGYDHTIKLWNISTALCLKTFQHPDSQVNVLQITPDRKSVAAGGFQHVRIYDVQGMSQNPTLNLEGLLKNVTTLGFNKDGSWMFTGGEDCNARIWDLRAGSPQCQKVFQTHSAPITSAALHPSQTELIVADQSGTVHCWDLRNDVETEQLIPDQNSPVAISHVDIDPKGNYLAIVNNKGDCYVWSLEGSETEPLKLNPFHKMKVHKRYALKCYFSPDSSLLATTAAENAKIYQTSTFNQLTELCNAQGRPSGQAKEWVWDAAFTGDSQYLITASSDNLARLWSVGTGACKREYHGHQKPLTCVAYRDPSVP